MATTLPSTINPQKAMNRSRSSEIAKEASSLIVGGVNSPVRQFKGFLESPLILKKSFKGRVVDSDGNEFIDLISSWGAIICGHAHPGIEDAITSQVKQGTSYGVTSEIEVAMAKEFKKITSWDLVRFVNSGTEATMTALRIARGYTNKKIIIKFVGNYHGHSDFLLVQAGSGCLTLDKQQASSAGVTEGAVKETLCLPYNNVAALQSAFTEYAGQIAAVILEPVTGNMGVIEAKREFLDAIEQLTQDDGALLILDEVMTGFRLSIDGAKGYLGLKADLACYSKIIGGGMPVGAIAGRKEVMESLAPIGTVYQAGTLSGNPVTQSAGLAALKLIQKPGFYEYLDHLGALIQDKVEACIKECQAPAVFVRVGSMMTLFMCSEKPSDLEGVQTHDPELFKAYYQWMFERGILLPPSQYEAWFLNASHTLEEMEQVARATCEFLRSI